jgi:hypothetical protein
MHACSGRKVAAGLRLVNDEHLARALWPDESVMKKAALTRHILNVDNA